MDRTVVPRLRIAPIALSLCTLAACADEDPDQGPAPAPSEIRTDLFDTPWGPQELTYRAAGGRRIFEGDILLPEPVRRGAVRTAGEARWPEGVVPYWIDPILIGTQREDDIRGAMALWEEATGVIQFVDLDAVAWEDENVDRVLFIEPSGTEPRCSSNEVGRSSIDGPFPQQVSLSIECDLDSVLHEIGHVLGLYHEQSRSDREDYIDIDWSNIEDAEEYQYYTYLIQGREGKNFGPYDHESIMHYSSFANAIDTELPTIVREDGSIIEDATAISDTDACAVIKFHGFSTRSDVNGDGFADLLVGSPSEDVGAAGDEGSLTVVFGDDALELSQGQLLHRGLAEVQDVAGTGDRFGEVVAAGDFDGDCLADVAVGVPYDDVGAAVDVGSVHVFAGTSEGLQDRAVLGAAAPAAGGLLGSSLAVGDFNADGYDDLAIGAPSADVAGADQAGSVTVLYGSDGGLGYTGRQTWSQAVATVWEDAEDDDHFGAALAAGDFDGDSYDDLVIGVPGEEVSGVEDAGAIHLLFGGPGGVTVTGNALYYEGPLSLVGVPTLGDRLGASLATGDFLGDGSAGLAIGKPGQPFCEDLDADGECEEVFPDAGAVTLVLGVPSGGLDAVNSVEWSQATLSADVPDTYDMFGHSLRAADFDGDGRDDLAVGVPLEDIEEPGAVHQNAGAVQVFYMSDVFGVPASAELWSQATAGIEGDPATDELMGLSLQVGDYRGDGSPDLAVGVPWEEVDGVGGAGAVQVIEGRHGAYGGLVGAGALVTQDPDNIPDEPETGDVFGAGL